MPEVGAVKFEHDGRVWMWNGSSWTKVQATQQPLTYTTTTSTFSYDKFPYVRAAPEPDPPPTEEEIAEAIRSIRKAAS